MRKSQRIRPSGFQPPGCRDSLRNAGDRAAMSKFPLIRVSRLTQNATCEGKRAGNLSEAATEASAAAMD